MGPWSSGTSLWRFLPQRFDNFVKKQVHAKYHTPDQATMIVDDLNLQMKKYIEANHMLTVGMQSFSGY